MNREFEILWLPSCMEKETTNNEKKKFDQIINEIETIVDCGFKLPGLGVVVSPKEIRNNLHSLRKAVNLAVEEAEHILKLKDNILEEARKEADEIVRRRQVELAKQPVLREADDFAKRLVTGAKEEAEKIVKGAQIFEKEVRERSHRYAEVIFDELENEIAEKKRKISRDREQLKMILLTGEEQVPSKKEAAEPRRKLS